LQKGIFHYAKGHVLKTEREIILQKNLVCPIQSHHLLSFTTLSRNLLRHVDQREDGRKNILSEQGIRAS